MAPPKGHAPYNVNGEGGRPRRYTELSVDELADNLENWILADEKNIFIERWCLENNIPEATISTDLVKNHRFSKAYNKFKSKQKLALFEGGLKRKYAHPMCALILSHNHNINQKTEQKITGDASNPLHCVLGGIDGSTKELVSDAEPD